MPLEDNTIKPIPMNELESNAQIIPAEKVPITQIVSKTILEVDKPEIKSGGKILIKDP